MKRELQKRETNYQPLVTRKQPCPIDHGLGDHFDESRTKNHSRTRKNDARFDIYIYIYTLKLFPTITYFSRIITDSDRRKPLLMKNLPLT